MKDGFIDSVWRSTPQEIAEDAGELAFDVAISVPTGGAGKVVSGAAKGIGKIKYLDNLVDIGKISQKIPSLQGMPLPAGGVLPFNLADDFLKAPYQMIKPDGEDVAKLTAKGGEIAKEALPDGKDVAQQAKNSFIKDAAKGMPVVEGVKGAEKVADNTPDRKNTPNTSKTDKMEGGENQKPANESGNDKKTTNEKDKTEGENTPKEKNSSDQTEGRKVTRQDNGGKTGSGVETSGEVKETKVEKIDGKGDSKIVTNNQGKEIDITPNKNHSTTNKNPGYKGEPNSSIDILDKDGNIVTRRWFDENGNAIRDVDMTNHGNSKQHPEWPHEHFWKYGFDGKPISR